MTGRIAIVTLSMFLSMTVYAYANPVALGFFLWSTVGAVLPSVSFATFVGIASSASGLKFTSRSRR